MALGCGMRCAAFGDRCIGLDAVPKERGRYRRFGFQEAYTNVRFALAVDGDSERAMTDGAVNGRTSQVKSLLGTPQECIELYDRVCFPRIVGVSSPVGRAWRTVGHWVCAGMDLCAAMV
jgi:hypothetical protein